MVAARMAMSAVARPYGDCLSHERECYWCDWRLQSEWMKRKMCLFRDLCLSVYYHTAIG